MRTKRWLVCGVLLAGMGLFLGLAGKSYSQREEDEGANLKTRLARKLQVRQQLVNDFFKELAPAVIADLRAGNQVVLPGLGTLRVVRVAEHRDLRNGRPVLIPAVNYVEFLPVQALVAAANSEGARPAVTVPAFQYNPLPQQTPSQRTPRTRTPSFRPAD